MVRFSIYHLSIMCTGWVTCTYMYVIFLAMEALKVVKEKLNAELP